MEFFSSLDIVLVVMLESLWATSLTHARNFPELDTSASQGRLKVKQGTKAHLDLSGK